MTRPTRSSTAVPRLASMAAAGAFGLALATAPVQFRLADHPLTMSSALAAGLLGNGPVGGNVGVGAGAGAGSVRSNNSVGGNADVDVGRDRDNDQKATKTKSRDRDKARSHATSQDRDDKARSHTKSQDRDRDTRGPSQMGISGAGNASERAEDRAAPNSAVGIGASGESKTKTDIK